jgi:hypothetical protein
MVHFFWSVSEAFHFLQNRLSQCHRKRVCLWHHNHEYQVVQFASSQSVHMAKFLFSLLSKSSTSSGQREDRRSMSVRREMRSPQRMEWLTNRLALRRQNWEKRKIHSPFSPQPASERHSKVVFLGYVWRYDNLREECLGIEMFFFFRGDIIKYDLWACKMILVLTGIISPTLSKSFWAGGSRLIHFKWQFVEVPVVEFIARTNQYSQPKSLSGSGETGDGWSRRSPFSEKKAKTDGFTPTDEYRQVNSKP